jgi:hypothetical protein
VIDEKLKKTLVDYDHENEACLIEGLQQVLEFYARRTYWKPSTGHRPHNLREGVHLDFHPSNVVDGWSFAEEALEKIDRYYDQKSTLNSLVKKNPISIVWWFLFMTFMVLSAYMIIEMLNVPWCW